MKRQVIRKRAGRVILADSNQNMLLGIRTLLETVFEVVVMVADERSLTDSLNRIFPDLVVVDLSLETTEEVNIVRRLNRINPTLKIIILSVHNEKTAVDECLSSGASGFVIKGAATNDLIPAIWDVMQGRQYISRSVNNNA